MAGADTARRGQETREEAREEPTVAPNRRRLKHSAFVSASLTASPGPLGTTSTPAITLNGRAIKVVVNRAEPSQGQ